MRWARRQVLQAAAVLPFAAQGARTAEQISLTLDARTARPLAADYMGLGFEASSVAMPDLLSAKNETYVQLVRNLGSKGVIRIGGNVSDFSRYDANGAPASAPKATVLTQANLRALAGFLDATGWDAIWGLNLGGGDVANAVEEARAVSSILGKRLLALQVGNEPDLFARAGHRQEPYGYGEWLADYRRTKTAIRTALPRALFAGPDAAFRVEWVEQFARDEGRDAAMLTLHHYIGGQADPLTTIPLMLAEDRKYQPVLARVRAAAAAAHLPWRMCETASFSGGGRAGVSDTFAAALWALDYLFVLASYGASGVNMETGVNHLGRISFYTPVGDDLNGHYSAAPEYYGLLAFAQMSQGELIGMTRSASEINLTAHAVRQSGATIVAVINKDAALDADVAITAPGIRAARVVRLTAPSLSAKDGIQLAGASVQPDGSWRAGACEPVRLSAGKAMLTVPAGSAALVTLSAT